MLCLCDTVIMYTHMVFYVGRKRAYIVYMRYSVLESYASLTEYGMFAHF